MARLGNTAGTTQLPGEDTFQDLTFITTEKRQADCVRVPPPPTRAPASAPPQHPAAAILVGPQGLLSNAWLGGSLGLGTALSVLLLL